VENKRKEQLLSLQKQYRIRVAGEKVPEMLDSFEKMQERYALSPQFMQILKQERIKRPSPVQMQAIPILFEKRDSIVLAETGSGKSLAFITPLVHMHPKNSGLRAIIIVPTRELAIQLYKEFSIFSEKLANMPKLAG